VEQTQKTNMLLKGKSEAFMRFRDLLAGEIVEAMPDTREEVERILETRVGGDAEEEGQNGEVKREEGKSTG